MFQMEAVVLVLVILLTAAGGAGVSPPELHGAPYEFQYGVEDLHHQTRFGHQEREDGRGNRQGRYYVALPDGRLQTVKYQVAEWSSLIGPDPSRYCALIGGTLLCWRQVLCHNNTPQGK